MPDLAAIRFNPWPQMIIRFLWASRLSMNCIILIWRSVAKIPVVSGLYEVEELEESERESTEISRRKCIVVKLRKREIRVVKIMH